MGRLHGKRILVVEDDWVVADEIARTLTREGAVVVGPAPSVDDCAALLSVEPALDGAVLDINLRGTWVYPLVDRLRTAGVPCLFLTGYDGDAIPGAYAGIRRFDKPVDLNGVVAVLAGGGAI